MAGLTGRQIQTRITAGRWRELYRDVFAVAGAPLSWEGRVLAACWAGGFRAFASHRTAAALHGLPGGVRDLVEITCPRWRRARHQGLIVHESVAITPADVTIVGEVPVTTPARTLFDLSGIYRTGFVELALENALRRGLVTLPALDTTVRRLSRRGRPGGPILRQLIAVRGVDHGATESEMETRLVQILRRSGLPEPLRQFEVWSGSGFVARVDLAYPDERVAVEYDSDEFHTGRVAVRRDRSRRHRLLAAGWIVIDVGPADVRRGGGAACAAIAHALRARSAGLGA